MKFFIYFLIFSLLPLLAFSTEETSLNKALTVLEQGKVKQAQHLFSKILKEQKNSQEARFNLALFLYQKTGKTAWAKAYWRQILFENPYSQQTKEALKKVKDKKYFWLWLPGDLVLALMALSLGIFLFLFYKKQGIIFSLFIILITHSFGIYYFFHRFGNYSTVIQDSPILNAPDPQASVQFSEKAGTLLKILPDSLPAWSHVQFSNNQRGWISTKHLIPVKASLNIKKNKLLSAPE